MDPATFLASVVVAGATSIANDALSEATKEGFSAFLKLLRRKVEGNSLGETAVANIEKNPDGWKAPLEQAIVQVGADQNTELLDVAQRLMAAIRSDLASTNTSNVQFNDKAQGVIIGPNGTMTNHFGNE